MKSVTESDALELQEYLANHPINPIGWGGTIIGQFYWLHIPNGLVRDVVVERREHVLQGNCRQYNKFQTERLMKENGAELKLIINPFQKVR